MISKNKSAIRLSIAALALGISAAITPLSGRDSLEEKVDSALAEVNRKTLQESRTNDCFQVVYRYSKNDNDKPQVIIVGDYHWTSINENDYADLISKLEPAINSVGLERGYIGKDPIETALENENEVLHKLGEPKIDQEGFKKTNKLIKKLVSSNLELYSLEDKELNLASCYLEKFCWPFKDIIEELKSNQKPAELRKYVDFYNFMMENKMKNLPVLDEQRLYDNKYLTDFWNRVLKVREELIDKRSYVASNCIEQYLKDNKDKTTLVVYGGYHPPEVSESLKQKGISHIVISTPRLEKQNKEDRKTKEFLRRLK